MCFLKQKSEFVGEWTVLNQKHAISLQDSWSNIYETCALNLGVYVGWSFNSGTDIFCELMSTLNG